MQTEDSMNRINIQRLLHTLLPFLIMTMIQRSLSLIFTRAGFVGEAADLCAFIPAVLAAALLFRIRTYTVTKEEHGEEAPLVTKSLFASVLRVLQASAVMIAAMIAVSAVLGGGEAQAGGVTALRVLALLVIHPVTEEFLFRKLFYGELRLMHPVFGVVAQALMFAIVHNSVDSMVYALASGIVLGILYEQTGRLSAVIAAHGIINLRSLLCLTLLAGYADIIQAMDIAIVCAGFAALLVQMILNGRSFPGYAAAEDGGNDAENKG